MNKESLPASTSFRVTFEPMGISCRGKTGQSLLDIAADQHLLIRSDCGGQGRCAKCLVAVNPLDHLSPITDIESERLSPEQREQGYRLACQATLQGPVKVSIPEEGLDSNEGIGKTGVPRHARRSISMRSKPIFALGLVLRPKRNATRWRSQRDWRARHGRTTSSAMHGWGIGD